MEANTYSLRQILSQDRRYVVPTFQRDYEWTKDQQWELLFSDLEALVDRLDDARRHAEATGESLSRAEKRVAPHFLGAIVLDQLAAPAGGIDLRAVIDGQQRLTTLQLMMRGVLDLLNELGSARARQVRRLLENPEDVVGSTLERHKLWPRRRDREAWIRVMADDEPVGLQHPYLDARGYFRERAREVALGPDGDDRSDTLVDAVLDLFKLVVIDLEDNDDAQVIFEVLNGRQTPLSASDLVKNLLFLRAELADEAELEQVYDTYWQPFDDRWWAKSVGSGHAARGRRDMLLSSWLTAVSDGEASVGHLYSDARRYLDRAERKTVDVLAELRDYGEAYRSFYGAVPVASTRLRVAYDRLDQLGVGTALPLILWLETIPEGRLTVAEHERAIRAVEAWVVRRMILGANTRGYNRVFIDVLRAAQSAEARPDASIAAAVVTSLRAQTKNLAWPSDTEVEEAFVSRRMYALMTSSRVLLILAAIDERLRAVNPLTEPGSINYSELQIEHVMPVAWAENWSLASSDDATRYMATQARDLAVDRIGNLTLVSPAFNRTVSNKAWTVKRPHLIEHSKLQINDYFAALAGWDEVAIEQRARTLAKVANEVFPTADRLLEEA